MEEALIGLLLRSGAVRSLVADSIYWMRKPQRDASPRYIVLQRISGPRNYTMRGASGYVQSRVQADVYADTYTSSKTIARAMTAALSGRRGGVIQGIFIDSERDLPAADAGDVTYLFRTSVDLIIHHHE
ncbi:DUF3168 domain-containing protein [Shinella sp. BYT-45]|uniref:tail completion protein gp17 n=1 Tax=Shinella sp. BYT-45 TaxID=3377377 RepID=UPI003980F1EA